MKAIRFHAHGSSDVLRYEDITEPSAKTGEALVRVRACALNHLDIWVRQGLPGVKIPLPHIPGCDISGVIEAVGAEEKNFKVGDEVIVSPGVSCGVCEHCLSGNDQLCRSYHIIGEHCDGGYAEKIAVSTKNLLYKPANLNFEQAASFPLVFLTAWHMLVTLGGVRPGHLVLIHAAGSGIGSAAVQIAKLHGASVIATASAQDKLDKARDLGADHLINYATENFQERVKVISGKRGVDIVFEHTGEKTFEGSYLSLCRGGRLVTCGASTGFNARVDLRYVFSRQLQIIGSTMGSKGELLQIAQLMEKDVLKPVIDRSFPLREAAAAQDYLSGRKQFGKVLVIP